MTIRHLNPWLNDHPEEAGLVAVMLAGYGELEYDLSVLVGQVLNDQLLGTRLLYRLRSESQRLDMADAIISRAAEPLGLAGLYSNMYGAVKWCKNMRNAYAHCHWIRRDDEDLCYFEFETAAKSSDPESLVKLLPVSAELLKSQAEYFHYTNECLQHFATRHAKLAGVSSVGIFHGTKHRNSDPIRRCTIFKSDFARSTE